MRISLAALIVMASASAGQPALEAQGEAPSTESGAMLDAKGDVARFYGVPMNLTPTGLKRLPFRYRIRHYSSEGDTYAFYTIRAQGGVEVEVQFDRGRLSTAKTSSPNAIGPKGVGVGSPLSAVKAAWPEGRLRYGVQENRPYVSFSAAEPGFMPNVMYYFDPKDMPPAAFDAAYRNTPVIIEVPENIRVKTIGIFPHEFPEEAYDFFAVTSGPCVPKIGVSIGPKQRAACDKMTEPKRFRGTWLVGFETSLFSPIGKPSCTEAEALASCAELLIDHSEAIKTYRPWSRWACPKLYRIEFVGRRNVLPGFGPYKITVDDVLASWPLPDPPHEPGECDEKAA